MKKIVLLISFLFLFVFCDHVDAKEVHVYLFYGNTCPICENLREYLEEFNNDNEIIIHEFEVYNNEENMNHLTKVKEMYGIKRDGVPFLVIGDRALLGFSDDRKVRIEDYILKYKEEDYYDRVGVYLGLYDDVEIEEEVVNSSLLTSDLNTKESLLSWKNVVGGIVIVGLLFLLGWQCFSLYKAQNGHKS